MWNMKISTMMNWPLGSVNNGHQMQKTALLELHISYEKFHDLKATLVFRYSENVQSRVSSLQRWQIVHVSSDPNLWILPLAMLASYV